jgi:hypothetical protein
MSRKIGSFTEEQLMELQKSPVDEFGVKHLNILYNFEANVLSSKQGADYNDHKLSS